MVSRKKVKGKARKAAKAKKEEGKEAHDDSSKAAAQQRGQEQEGAEAEVEAQIQIQMQRLLIDSLVCKHGFDIGLASHCPWVFQVARTYYPIDFRRRPDEVLAETSSWSFGSGLNEAKETS